MSRPARPITVPSASIVPPLLNGACGGSGAGVVAIVHGRVSQCVLLLSMIQRTD